MQAKRKPLMMDVGWIFCFANSSAFFNSSAAIITYNNTKTYSLLLQIKDFIVLTHHLGCAVSNFLILKLSKLN